MDSLTAAPQPLAVEYSLSEDERKLLAKLEEQNRLLEKGNRSLTSINENVQKPISPKTFRFEEDWDCVLQEWDEWCKKRVTQLKELIRRGIPAPLRPAVWGLLCDAQSVSLRQQYPELPRSSSSETLLRRKLERIFAQHQLFQAWDASVRDRLLNVLKAYSVLDQEIGCCLGSLFITGLLITEMPELEAFCVLVRLMKDFRLQELYSSSTVELGCCVHQLDCMIQEQLPELHSHFKSQGLSATMFSSSWFLSVLISFLPNPVAVRVFDIFMCEIVFRVALAVLHMKQTELMKLDIDRMMKSLEYLEETELDPDTMIQAAYKIKYDPRKMKQMRKDYASIKSKELDEQKELKRLYLENKYLKNRLETIENRSSEYRVSQMKMELEKTLLSSADIMKTLKALQEKISQDSTDTEQNRGVDLQMELIRRRLREAEALSELKEHHQQIKDLHVKWQQVCSGQPKGGSLQFKLQVELLSARLEEALTQAALKESRHRLLQLQTEKNHSRQLKCVESQISIQQRRVQELTTQNQDLHHQYQSSGDSVSSVKLEPQEKEEESKKHIDL